jgi:hypothetical protein
MKEVDEDAWAAVRRVLDWTRPTLTASEANDLTTVLSLLPDALTNPQPALPTEPGVYSLPATNQAHLGNWHTDGIELHYLNADGNWSDVGWGNVRENEKRPFTRLVPERPQPTSEEIREAWGISRESDKSIPREPDGRMLAAHAYEAGYKAGAKR